MKDAEDEAFDELARRQGSWGGGFNAKRAAAADKMQEPPSEWEGIKAILDEYGLQAIDFVADFKAALAQPAQESVKHWSDCAVHDGPAYPAGECDCGAAQKTERKALRLALEALEDLIMKHFENTGQVLYKETYAIVEEALAQPAQKPVANSFEEYCKTLPPLWNTHISRTYAEQFFRAGQAAQPAQEPVAWTLLLTGEHHGIIGEAGEKFIGAPECYQRVNVYTISPKRPWVSLTDEETQAYWDWEDWQTGAGRSTIFEMVRDIEAKLKERNG